MFPCTRTGPYLSKFIENLNIALDAPVTIPLRLTTPAAVSWLRKGWRAGDSEQYEKDQQEAVDD